MKRRFALTIAVAGVVACGAFGTSSDDATPPAGTSSGTTTGDGGTTTKPDGAVASEAGLDGAAHDGATFASAVLALDGLLAYWRLGEAKGGGTASDSSGHGHTASYSIDGVASVAGLVASDSDPACELSALGSVQAPPMPLDANFTVGVLIRSTVSQTAALVQQRGHFELGLDFTGRASLTVPNQGMPLFGELVGTNATLIIGTLDTSGTSTIYVNGKGSTPKTGTPMEPVTGSVPTCMGAASEALAAPCQANPFKGVIDEVFIVSKAIDVATVARLTQLAGVD